MKDSDKTKEQLIAELEEPRERVPESKKSETERKQADEALQASHRFLKIANSHTEMIPLLNEFVSEIKKLTGCDAVGMRMLDVDGNIPYEAYEGFSQSFYELESPLSIKSDQCMCINVIKGMADPKLSFYTEGGSFYMNCTSRFLVTISEKEKGRTRNVCNQVGYESVALVPIRLGDRILGLIHVADHQENMVPLELVRVLEWAAMQLGTAIQRVQAEEELRKAHDELEQRVVERTAELMRANEQLQRQIEERQRAEEALRESEEKYRQLISTTPDAFMLFDADTRQFIEVNEACEGLYGYSREEFLNLRHRDITDEPEKSEESIKQLVNGKLSRIPVRYHRKKDGTVFPIEISGSTFVYKGRDVLCGLIRDITERQRGEEALRKREAELLHQSRHLEELNAALKVLLKRREDDKIELEENVVANVKELVFPYLEKLKKSQLDPHQETLVSILESHIRDIVSPFATKLSSRYLNLTTTEIQVASLIKDGRTNKEIADLLHLSVNTIRSHRFHIRSKLGLKNKKINLRSYLRSLQYE